MQPAGQIRRSPAIQKLDRPSITILLPAKNEEGGIEATIAQLPVERLREIGYPVEILVADGKSRDRTREIAAKYGARVVRQLGTGKGRGVRTAVDVAKGEYIVMLDADGTYPARAIPAFLAMLEEGYDVVMGTRMAGRIEPGAMKPLNRVGNHGLSMLASVLYGRRCTDVCTGMWAFRKDMVRKLDLTSTHFEIEAELFARSVQADLRLVEVPITYTHREGDTKLGGIREGLRIGRALVNHRFKR